MSDEQKRCYGKGELNSNAKLTEQKVREIRAAYATGQTTMRRLAAEYGVCFRTVYCVVRRQTWNCVAD